MPFENYHINKFTHTCAEEPFVCPYALASSQYFLQSPSEDRPDYARFWGKRGDYYMRRGEVDSGFWKISFLLV